MARPPKLNSNNLPQFPARQESEESPVATTDNSHQPHHDELDLIEQGTEVDLQYEKWEKLLADMRAENDRYEELVQRQEAANNKTKEILKNATDTEKVVTALKDSINLAIEGFSKKIIKASKLVIKATLIPEDVEKLRQHSETLRTTLTNYMNAVATKCKENLAEHYRQIRDLAWDSGNGVHLQGKIGVFISYLSISCIILVIAMFTAMIVTIASR